MSKVLPRVILYYVEVGARFCWGVHFGYVIDAYYRLWERWWDGHDEEIYVHVIWNNW